VPRSVQWLTQASNAQRQLTDASRKVLFLMCNALQLANRRAETEPQLAAAEVPRLIGEFVALTDAVQLLSQEPQSESAVKSFRATADTLAVAMWWWWQQPESLVTTELSPLQRLNPEALSVESGLNAAQAVVLQSMIQLVRSTSGAAAGAAGAGRHAPTAVLTRLTWMYAPAIATANRAAASGDFGLAAMCANLVFQLVLVGVPLGAPSPACSAATVEAATEFALGCGGFGRSDAIQQAGVKLLGALLTAGRGEDTSDAYVNAMTEAQLVRAVAMTDALRTIGTDAAVRKLAEQLHETLASAARAMA
jgi:hypothetical protein